MVDDNHPCLLDPLNPRGQAAALGRICPPRHLQALQSCHLRIAHRNRLKPRKTSVHWTEVISKANGTEVIPRAKPKAACNSQPAPMPSKGTLGSLERWALRGCYTTLEPQSPIDPPPGAGAPRRPQPPQAPSPPSPPPPPPCPPLPHSLPVGQTSGLGFSQLILSKCPWLPVLGLVTSVPTCNNSTWNVPGVDMKETGLPRTSSQVQHHGVTRSRPRR